MGVFGRLFGSDKHISKGMGMIDDAFYTKQEQAKDDIKRTNAKLLFLKTYEAFKVAQRFVAIIISIPFVSIHFIIVINWLLAIWIIADKVRYDFMVEQFKLIAELNNMALGEPLGYIVIFYFLGGAGEGMINKFMSRRAKK